MPPLKKLELSEAMGKELSGVVSRMHSTKRVAVPDMKAGTSEADLAEKASNSRKLLPSQNGGGEHYGEVASKSRHVWVGATNAKQSPMMPRNKSTDGTKTGVPRLSGTSGESLVNGYVLTRGIEEAE